MPRITIQAATKDAYQLFHDGSLALARASRVGMQIDLPYCVQQIKQLNRIIKQNESDFWNTSTGQLWIKVCSRPNLNSDTQLRKILYDNLKLTSTKYTKKGKRSVDSETLSMLNTPGMEQLLTVRKLSKTVNTFLKGIFREQVDGVLHPMYNLNIAKTYRSSSDHVNFQNIPKRDKDMMQAIRGAIFARKDHQIYEVDFSGIEVRIAACYHQDPTMLKYILDPTTDMHRDMAIQLYDLSGLDKKCPGEKQLRYGAKNGFVFPQFYGDYYGNNAPALLKIAAGQNLADGTPVYEHLQTKGYIKLNKDGTIRNSQKFVDHVQEVENDFWEHRFQVYKQWKDANYARYQRTGYVELFTGFRCGGVMSRNECNNYPVQGAAFHCLLWSFIETDRLIEKQKLDSKLTGQIHDSMLIDLLPDEYDYLSPHIRHITTHKLVEHWPWIIVPMDVEEALSPVNQSWAVSEED